MRAAPGSTLPGRGTLEEKGHSQPKPIASPGRSPRALHVTHRITGHVRDTDRTDFHRFAARSGGDCGQAIVLRHSEFVVVCEICELILRLGRGEEESRRRDLTRQDLCSVKGCRLQRRVLRIKLVRRFEVREKLRMRHRHFSEVVRRARIQ